MYVWLARCVYILTQNDNEDVEAVKRLLSKQGNQAKSCV